jgi:Sec-independent protein translocase protein TatA
MPFLSPAKLLVILVIALVVLGPDRLPKVSRQIGGLWGDFRKFREKLESEVRGSFPDLPSTDTITHAVRSPVSFLDGLARSQPAESGASATGDGAIAPGVDSDTTGPWSSSNRPTGAVDAHRPPSVSEMPPADPAGVVHRVRPEAAGPADDPGMN